MTSLPRDPANPEKKKGPSATRSVLAGATAGAIEIGAPSIPRHALQSDIELADELTIQQSHILPSVWPLIATAINTHARGLNDRH